MKNEIEQQIFEKMKAKDFGESMCNETKLNVLKWTMQQLRKHNVSGSLPLPDFLYNNGYGRILSGVHGDSDVSDEWDKWKDDIFSNDH